MSDTIISLGKAVLSSAQKKILAEKFEDKKIDLLYQMSDTDLDGDFHETRGVGLWEEIAGEINFPKPVRAKEAKFPVTKPGEHIVSIETVGKTYKGKVHFKLKPGDKSMPQIKKNSHPPHVSVKNSGAKKTDLPAAYYSDLDDLVAIMKLPQSYSYVGGTGSHKGWSVDFGKHLLHEQPGHGWKAYIDISRGTGTTWRLYFDIEFDVPTKTLEVSMTSISEDH